MNKLFEIVCFVFFVIIIGLVCGIIDLLKIIKTNFTPKPFDTTNAITRYINDFLIGEKKRKESHEKKSKTN